MSNVAYARQVIVKALKLQGTYEKHKNTVLGVTIEQSFMLADVLAVLDARTVHQLMYEPEVEVDLMSELEA